jgi:DNA-binding PadR family transcriptional regulator
MNFRFWEQDEHQFSGRGRCGGFHAHGFRSGRHGWGGRGGNPFGGNPFGGNPFERTERIFDQGDLRYVILYLIAERPRHGYEIIKAIEEGTGGSYSPSPGVVYPTLTMLEEMGLASVESAEGSKKLYAITGEGRTVLEANRAKVEAILERMQQTSNSFTAGSVMRVMRALMQLKTIVKVLVKSGSMTDEQVNVVADALEEAARKIQQM